jgi:porin
MNYDKRKKTVLRQSIFGLAVLLSVSRSVSEENSAAPAPKSALEQFAEQDYLFGTWGGLRTALSKRGVDFEFFYIASNPHNISGGIDPGSVYEGALLMLLDLDSQKLAGYDGGHFHVGGVWIHGEDHFSDEHIGDLNKVNLIDFPHAGRLWELWYEQKFWGDRVSLKVGQMAVDQDFITAEFYNSLGSITLLNQTFFYPTLAFNVYNIPGFPGPLHALPSSPYGAPGVRLKVKATDQLYFQVAGYDGYPDQDNGTHLKFNAAQGALVYGEAGYRFNQLKGDTGLPGNLKLGGWYHTSDFPDNFSFFQAQLGMGPVRFHPNTYGGYFLADQMLFREIGKEDPAQQGLVGFFRLTGAPPDRNLTEFGVDGGLVYKGLIPTRDWDTIALAGSYLQMSDDIRKGQRLINSAAPGTFPDLADCEGAVEISYKAQMTAWWTMQVSFERAIHPGGHTSPGRNPSDAWAFILASTLRF